MKVFPTLLEGTGGRKPEGAGNRPLAPDVIETDSPPLPAGSSRLSMAPRVTYPDADGFRSVRHLG